MLSREKDPNLGSKGPSLFFMLCKDIGWVGESENGNFSLLYVLKVSLRRGVDASKKSQNSPTQDQNLDSIVLKI